MPKKIIDKDITRSKFIYKYMPINEFTLKALINNELFFGIPKEFNDPLDCKFSLRLDPPPTFESAKSFYAKENLSEEIIAKKMEVFKYDKTQIQNDIEDNYIEHLRKGFCISCFSEKYDSILMWSHYADKHKGICVKFDWRVHSEYFKGYKVKYSSKLPELTYNGNGKMDVANVVLTKLNHWKYEKEIRSIVRLEEGIQSAAFNPKSLKGIIFGERISEIDKKTIKNIIKGNNQYLNVEYFKAQIEKKNLKVTITKE